MEKRVVLFMVLSAAIMFAYVALQSAFGPKPEPPAIADKAEPGKKKSDQKTLNEKKADEKKSDKKQSDEEKPDEEPGTSSDDETDVEATRAEPNWATLGSVDPASPYRMLVTFSSKGGAIERIEMASSRYRDLDDRSGYLGHLALTPTKGNRGAKINVVGAGTPAAIAGLKPGDIIEAVYGEAVKGPAELHAALRKTKPGNIVPVDVSSGDTKRTVNVEIARRPLEVIRPEMEGGEGPDPAVKVHPLSGLLTLAGPRQAGSTSAEAPTDPLRTAHWELTTKEQSGKPVVEATYRLSGAQAKKLGLAGPVEVIRRYTLATVSEEDHDNAAAMAYHLDCQVEIRNLTNEPITAALVIDGPNGLPLEGWWYTNKIGPTFFGGAGARDIVWRPHGRGRFFRSCNEVYKYAKKNEDKPGESLLGGGDESTRLDYIGVDAQYFSAIWMPSADSEDGSPFRSAISMPASGIEKIQKVDYKRTNVTFRMTSDLKNIPAEGSYKQTMRLFAGPKVPELMAQYDGMDDVIEYGWFRVVSIPLAALLHFLKHNLFFNYGLAIVALTVIVRGCMVPFSLKAAKNAKMMQDLGPEMRALKEKYKNDMQKYSEAQSALFKKHNYNPLSGCLPMFLQLPIFLGLYRALATDIELRQAPLIPGIEWASNLAGPDKLFRWADWEFMPNFLVGEASGWLGPYFNILPLVSVAFLLVHQKLFTPPATDEQTKMTQDMMKYMTVFMGVLFFKVPAGLCIYFITSSLWSVCERLWLPKTGLKPAADGGVAAKLVPTSPKPSNNGVKEAREARAKKLKQRKK